MDINVTARYDPFGVEAANGGSPFGRGFETWRVRPRIQSRSYYHTAAHYGTPAAVALR